MFIIKREKPEGLITVITQEVLENQKIRLTLYNIESGWRERKIILEELFINGIIDFLA